ncbi:MAG: hypothetical protein H6Q65_1682 [Firmicutes bacterium]|nr:hypothetical protein [Bacillota bacterium]
MRSALYYFYDVMRHKWHVLSEAYKLGILWRGLTHDLSKFNASERGPRRRLKNQCSRDAQGNIRVCDELAFSWVWHYHKNPHHWQWWVTTLDDGSCKVFPMTDEYRREMLADWRAVARIPGRLDIIPWYRQNRDRIILHPETRQWIEEQIGIPFE